MLPRKGLKEAEGRTSSVASLAALTASALGMTRSVRIMLQVMGTPLEPKSCN